MTELQVTVMVQKTTTDEMGPFVISDSQTITTDLDPETMAIDIARSICDLAQTVAVSILTPDPAIVIPTTLEQVTEVVPPPPEDAAPRPDPNASME